MSTPMPPERPSTGAMSHDETPYLEHYVLPVRTRSAESPSSDGQETSTRGDGGSFLTGARRHPAGLAAHFTG